ncbi:hypothetical protein J6590_032992 [Homalodisca vitripennis]|nr:hypothetical protein J6590_032992 [Homalodisca vitripennis]
MSNRCKEIVLNVFVADFIFITSDGLGLQILQLPQVEVNGQETNGRRFRVENGDSLGEKEEVSNSSLV